MNRTELLEKENVVKLLLKFSAPAIVGMLVNALYNVIDRYFVGNNVGSDAIAGITICFPIMIILMAFGMLVGFGGTALVSIKLGEQKKQEAEKILGNAFVLLIAISGCVSVISLFFVDELLTIFGASADILPFAKEYITIILCGAVFQSIGFGLNNFIRGEGNPKIAASTMLIGAITNIILDYLFIKHLNLGIKGAALATIIGQLVSAIWVLRYFLSGKSLLRFHVSNMKLELSTVKKIFALGSAPFAMQVASSAINALFNHSLYTYGGDTAISAMGLINSIAMFILMPIFGINQGAQPIIGYNYGAKQYHRVKKTYSFACIMATSIVLVGFIITRLYPKQLFMLFNKDDELLIELGTEGIKIFLIMLPIIGFQIISSNYFQAIGKPKQAMLLSLTRQVLILIPAILILPNIWGLKGVWISGPISDFLSSFITAIFIVREMKTLSKKAAL
ncbi:MATE family efflux transporter [Abyssisolibacter fermentans]|uniref:MATE family efflux transporter n=1 Tax=Abyssisolibacter fermentans TaxID=1766203 RepID=UPI0008336013|nr:MATE family efflux transporter [Abyssisolibacter fermentans]